ncbi:MBL fold metallo-hydrolase [Ancylomarina sp.]|uniref:MBL fold metallo-hydrolase n=1 Tax=Ancylomarina sp. TaxID=1970196 RepID=UPI003564B6AC
MKKIFTAILLTLFLMTSSSLSAQYQIQMVDIDHGNGFLQNGYVLYNMVTKDALIVDPGKVDQQIEDFISENNLKVGAIFNTHGHGDHVGGNAHYQKLYKVAIYAHTKDANMYRNKLAISFFDEKAIPSIEGFANLKVYYIPGHTQGCIALHIANILITGDTLQKEGIGSTPGRTDEDDEKYTQMELNSIITKLMVLPDSTLIYPGHGYDSSIGHERENNGWLQ